MGGFIFPPYDISQFYESENPVQIIVHQCTYSSGGGGNNLWLSICPDLPSKQWRGPRLKGSDFALQLVYLFETLIFFQLFGFVFDCFS